MKRTIARRLVAGEHYAAGDQPVFRQITENFRSREISTIAVRRVIPTGGTEELQISITLEEIYSSGRSRSMHESFILSPDDADAFGRACLEMLKREAVPLSSTTGDKHHGCPKNGTWRQDPNCDLADVCDGCGEARA